jgi:hypothetical protein
LLGVAFEVRPLVLPPPTENTPGKVSRNHGATSHLAALHVRPRRGTQRWRILKAIEGTGASGATRDQLCFWLRSISPNSLRPRVLELIEGGHVVVTDRYRNTPSGQRAEVLVASKFERTLV